MNIRIVNSKGFSYNTDVANSNSLFLLAMEHAKAYNFALFVDGICAYSASFSDDRCKQIENEIKSSCLITPTLIAKF